jgi:hypothetical protein
MEAALNFGARRMLAPAIDQTAISALLNNYLRSSPQSDHAAILIMVAKKTTTIGIVRTADNPIESSASARSKPKQMPQQTANRTMADENV